MNAERKADKSSRIITGIDIGTTKVCTIIAHVDESENIDIRGVGISQSEGMKKGLVVDLEAVTQSVNRSVSKAEKMAEHVVDRAFIGITGSHISSVPAHGAANVADPHRGVTLDDVRGAIDAARYIMLPPEKEIIDIVEQGYRLDGHSGIVDPIGMSGNRLEVDIQIITGATAFLQNVAKSVLRLDIGVDGLILEPIASGEAVLNNDEKHIGVVLLDIGGGTTDLAVLKNRSLIKTQIFPVGGDHIDNDIAVGLSTSPREAERLKIQYGRAYAGFQEDEKTLEVHLVGRDEIAEVPRGLLCEIIQPRVVELLEMIADELGSDIPPEAIPAGVVLTGGGALLDGMLPMAERILNMHVRLGYPQKVRTQYDKVASPIYATAVGVVRCAARRLRTREENVMARKLTPRAVIDRASRFFRGFLR